MKVYFWLVVLFMVSNLSRGFSSIAELIIPPVITALIAWLVVYPVWKVVEKIWKKAVG